MSRFDNVETVKMLLYQILNSFLSQNLYLVKTDVIEMFTVEELSEVSAQGANNLEPE